MQIIYILGTLSALVELEPVSFPSMPLDLACFSASVVTMKGMGMKVKTRMANDIKTRIEMKMKTKM